jgi:hypothetical protein
MPSFMIRSFVPIADVEFGNAYDSDAAVADRREQPVSGSPACRPVSGHLPKAFEIRALNTRQRP